MPIRGNVALVRDAILGGIIVRSILLSAAAMTAMTATAAWADGGCPPKAAPELLTALGEPAATIPGGQAIYQPPGVAMLGMPVSYVVVTKSSDGAVQEIDYRFAGVTRKYGDRFPQPVLLAFDKSYSTSCGGGKVTSCGAGFDAKAVGDLSAAEINEAYIDLPAKPEGAALAMVKADFASQNQGPVFLVCQYNAGS
jgi:hypothetical protein